jgi:hypothetical protein
LRDVPWIGIRIQEPQASQAEAPDLLAANHRRVRLLDALLLADLHLPPLMAKGIRQRQ